MVVPLLVLAIVALVVFLVRGSGPGAPAPPRTATSPVDLATPVDMAAGVAHPSAVVRSGDARIEVLSPTLLRLEYSPIRPPSRTARPSTPSTAGCRCPTTRTRVSGGWLTVQTSAATLRYEVGSGPFTPTNTSLRFSVGSRTSTVRPTWEWECPFDQICQAGAASLAGGAELSQTQAGYRSSAGYVGYLDDPGARATWTRLGAPAGPAVLAIRYSNLSTPPFSPAVRAQIGLVVDGRPLATVPAPPTDDHRPVVDPHHHGDPEGGHQLGGGGQRCGSARELSRHPVRQLDLGIDTLSIAPAGAPAPAPAATDPLGGWIRGFDTFTYEPGPTVRVRRTGATCQSALEPLHTDGLLDRAGWRLLDDTQSALWTGADGSGPATGGRRRRGRVPLRLRPRLRRRPADLRPSSPGPPRCCPRNVFGVWYSDYTPVLQCHHRGLASTPPSRAATVPLNTLSLDTDWKAPNNWDGWEWNTALFPDPAAFLHWARSQGIDVTLNIHSSIDDNDPELPAAERIAGDTLAASSCSAGPCKVWDWSTVTPGRVELRPPAELPEARGCRSGGSTGAVTTRSCPCPGSPPTPGSTTSTPRRWWTRVSAASCWPASVRPTATPDEVYPAGPWSDHTSAIAFTGDAWGTWNTLAQRWPSPPTRPPSASPT